MKVTAKHKYARLGFIYLFGLICASFLDGWACIIVFAVLALIFGFSVSTEDAFLKLSITFIAAAFLVFGLYKLICVEPCVSLDGQKATVTAVVTDSNPRRNDTVQLDLSGTADGKRIRLTLFTEDTGIKPGDKLEFEASFSGFSDTAEFSESSYNFSKGIFLKAYAIGDITVTSGRTGVREIANALSAYLRSNVDSSFSDGNGGMIKALFFGDKSGLSYKTVVDMRRSGISHLTAVSGAHLSLMVHLVSVILLFFMQKNGRRFFIVISAYILFLMLFFGMSPSVMRSGFMMIVIYAAVLLRRKADILSAVGAALLVILIINPLACRDMGLLLSVTGTIGVGVVSPAVSEALHINRKNIILKFLVASMCASVCIMPIGALCFDGLSLCAPLTALLVQPFFTVIIMLTPIALIFPVVTQPFLLTAGLCADAMSAISGFIGSFDFLYIPIDGRTVITFILLMASGTVITVYLSGGKAKSVILFTVLSVYAFVASQALYGIIGYNDITIKVIADSESTILCVDDKTGSSFYMLEASGSVTDTIYEYSQGGKANFLCVSSDNGNESDFSSFSKNIHIYEDGDMIYDVSGEYTATVSNGEILLDIRGITIGLLPAGSTTPCDISIYCGYMPHYGADGKTATILCDRKYYNCGEAVNAFLKKTEIIINSDGKYALSVE